MISMKHLAVALGIAGLAAAGAVIAAEGKPGGCAVGEQAAGEHRHGHGMERMAAMHGRMGEMRAGMHGERHGQRHDHGVQQEEKKEEPKK